VIKLVDNDGDEETDLDRFVKAVGNRIGKESKQLAPDRSRYDVRVNPSLCLKYVSPILLSLLENISDRFISSNASLILDYDSVLHIVNFAFLYYDRTYNH
jgi:tRNA A37 threonylcarbamoyladenosine dehydratase